MLYDITWTIAYSSPGHIRHYTPDSLFQYARRKSEIALSIIFLMHCITDNVGDPKHFTKLESLSQVSCPLDRVTLNKYEQRVQGRQILNRKVGLRSFLRTDSFTLIFNGLKMGKVFKSNT